MSVTWIRPCFNTAPHTFPSLHCYAGPELEAAQQRRVLAALLHRIPAGSGMQPAAVQASQSLGLHSLRADLQSQHSLGRSNVDIWGPVVCRSARDSVCRQAPSLSVKL